MLVGLACWSTGGPGDGPGLTMGTYLVVAVAAFLSLGGRWDSYTDRRGPFFSMPPICS